MRVAWREIERSWMSSNAVEILIARGEGDDGLGEGEGGMGELESLELAERRLMSASEELCRSSCGGRWIGDSWIPDMETLELRNSRGRAGLVIRESGQLFARSSHPVGLYIVRTPAEQ